MLCLLYKHYVEQCCVKKIYLLAWDQPRFVLNMFLFLREFQPECSYKIVLIKKKECKRCILTSYDVIWLRQKIYIDFNNALVLIDVLHKYIPKNVSTFQRMFQVIYRMKEKFEICWLWTINKYGTIIRYENTEQVYICTGKVLKGQ